MDSLIVYDGGSKAAPIIGEYCGDSIPPSHVSSSNRMLLFFQTGILYTYKGFQLEYQPYGNIPFQK